VNIVAFKLQERILYAFKRLIGIDFKQFYRFVAIAIVIIMPIIKINLVLREMFLNLLKMFLNLLKLIKK